MARVSLETAVWTDRRFRRVAASMERTHYDVIARMAELWSIATEQERTCLDLFTVNDVFRHAATGSLLVESGLAFDCEEHPDCFLLAGSERLLWLSKKRQTARINGRKGGRPIGKRNKPTSVTKLTGVQEQEQEQEQRILTLTSPGQNQDHPSPKTRAADARRKRDAGVHRVTANLIEYLNRKADRELQPTTHDKRVRDMLKRGYTERELKVVVWHAIERLKDKPERKNEINPATLFKLRPPPQYPNARIFPDYLEVAIEHWNKTHKQQPFQREDTTT